jgi:dolichol-phosphate mannosyltransferase
MDYPSRPLVILPTYNERENITQILPAILAAHARLHVLVVDDSSPDRTAEEVLKLAKSDAGARIHLRTRPGKQGLGSAYVQGFRWGLDRGYDFMIQMDADWSHNPADLPRMLELAREADFVIASRYIPGGGTLNWGAGRKLLSKSAGVYCRWILHAHFSDFTGGFNGWSRKVLEGIGVDSLRSDGYGFQIELKYRADQLGYTYIEFPILFTDRRAGKSKMSVSIAWEACWRVWGLRLGRRRFIRLRAAAPDPTTHEK